MCSRNWRYEVHSEGDTSSKRSTNSKRSALPLCAAPHTPCCGHVMFSYSLSPRSQSCPGISAEILLQAPTMVMVHCKCMLSGTLTKRSFWKWQLGAAPADDLRNKGLTHTLTMKNTLTSAALCVYVPLCFLVPVFLDEVSSVNHHSQAVFISQQHHLATTVKDRSTLTDDMAVSLLQYLWWVPYIASLTYDKQERERDHQKHKTGIQLDLNTGSLQCRSIKRHLHALMC